MRFGVHKLPIAVALIALPLTVVGARVVACNTPSTAGSASQSINTGSFALHLGSSTHGAMVNEKQHTVICPTVTLMHSTDAVGADCRFDVQSTGTIRGSEIKITATLVSSGFTLSRFTLHPNAGRFTVPAPFTLDALARPGSRQVIADIPKARVGDDTTVDPAITWQGLTNSDLGGNLTMTYAVVLTE